MQGLGSVKTDYSVCLFCGKKDQDISYIKGHIQDPELKVYTPTYCIGDRVEFKIGSLGTEHGGGQ